MHRGAPAGSGLAVPGGLLVGVFAVAQALAGGQFQSQGRRHRCWELGCAGQLSRKPAADRRVVASGVLESFQRQLAPQGSADGSGAQTLKKGAVLAGAGQHHHIGVIFGRCPHHCRSTDIDVLDGGIECHLGVGNGFSKWVKVDHHHVDRRNALGLQISLVAGLAAPGQDAAMDAWVQGLDPAAQDLRGAGVLRHLGDLKPGRLEGRSGAAT